MEDINSLDQSQLNSLLGGGSGQSLIPDSLMTILTISFVVINLLGILFMAFWIIGMVRRWKVQSAILHMQKDVAEIKQSLAKPAEPVPVTQPVAGKPQQPELEKSTPTEEPFQSDPSINE